MDRPRIPLKPDSKSANLPGQKSAGASTTAKGGKGLKESKADSMRRELREVLKELDKIREEKKGIAR